METQPISGGLPSLVETDRLAWRPVAAAMVDLALIAGVGLVVATALVERFTIVRSEDGTALFTPTEQARINELAGFLSRGYELGDTLLAFSTTSVLIVAGSVLAAALGDWIVLPLTTGGQSMGKKLFGHRTYQQSPPPATETKPAKTSPIEKIQETVPHPGHVLSKRSAKKLNSDRQRPDQITSQHHGDRIEMSDKANVERQHDPAAGRAAARRVPVEERSTNPYPKPTRSSGEERPEAAEAAPKAASTGDGSSPGYDSLALPESSLSDMPLTNTALFEALGLTPDDIAKLDGGPENQAPPQQEIAPEPAPRPTLEQAPAPSAPQSTQPQRSTLTDLIPPHPSSPFNNAKRAEPPHPADSHAPVASAPTPAPNNAPQVSPIPEQSPPQQVVSAQMVAEQARPEQGSSPAPDNRAPIWSEDWEAWIYWDTTLGGWFRHDESGNWVPMDQ